MLCQDSRPGDRVWTDNERWVVDEDSYDTGESETVSNHGVADYHPYFVGMANEWSLSVRVRDSDGCVHRVGGGDAKNLSLKPPEAKLDPPGISVLIGGTPADTAAAFRRVFGPKSGLEKAAGTVGTAEIEQIRAVGFDVVPVPTSNFPNHGRIIHPTEEQQGSHRTTCRSCLRFSPTRWGCDDDQVQECIPH